MVHFRQMRSKVWDFNHTSKKHSNFVKDNIIKIIEEWRDIEIFVLWEYTYCHLEVEDTDVCHCYTYALGGMCTIYQHESTSCLKYSNYLTFFETRVKGFLQ